MTAVDLPPPARLGTSIGKAMALLDAFTADVPSLGASELARRAGVPKSTTHRLLAFL
jgi:DNA-binding IclR family transcriptional regulator